MVLLIHEHVTPEGHSEGEIKQLLGNLESKLRRELGYRNKDLGVIVTYVVFKALEQMIIQKIEVKF